MSIKCLLAQKSDQYIYEPKYICDQKLGEIPFIGLWHMLFTVLNPFTADPINALHFAILV